MLKNGVRTFHPEDISPQDILPGTFHSKDISPRRHFTPRTFHPTDISPHFFTNEYKSSGIKKEQILRNWCVNIRTNSIKGLDLKAAFHILNAY